MKTTTDKVECQVCGGMFSADKSGNVGRHGYKRPGDGYLHGECTGQGHKPFPAHDALDAAIAFYTPVLAKLESNLEAFKAWKVGTFSVVYVSKGRIRKYDRVEVETYALGVTSHNTLANAHQRKCENDARDIAALTASIGFWTRRAEQAKAAA